MNERDDIVDLFCSLVDLSDEAQRDYLARGAFDTSTVAKVLELLEHEKEAGDLLPVSTEPRFSLKAGQDVGDFKLISELGRGGMGVVFLAEERTLERLVALKFLSFASIGVSDNVARLRREARLVAKLTHPSVVKILRFDEFDSTVFIAYEYIEGSDLSHLIAEKKGLTRDIRQAARCLADIADALHHAHQNKIVHRDVKPSNILVDLKQRGYLTDFGLATAEFEAGITRTGALAGTCQYMSPEQAAARTASIDYRTDIFSLGVVLYELASHRPPFRGDSNPAILNSIINDEPEALRSLNPTVPRDLELICAKAMQKRPEDRFLTAADMATDLRRFAEGDAIVTRAPTPWTQLKAYARKNRARLLQVSAVCTALAAGIWFGYILPRANLAVVAVSAPDNATTDALALDPATGEYVPLRTLGRGQVEARLPPGHYRFRIASDDGAFAELSREVTLEQPVRIEGARLAKPDELSNMIPIAAGPFTGGLGPYTEQWPRQVYDGHGFYIARHEVTNAEFRRYMDATGNPGPRYLTDRYDPALARRPVVRVTWYQARDYAEWAGARLPTRLEWDRAARGVDGGLYPWGEDNDLQADVCVGKIEERPNADGWFEAYAASACDVGSSRFDVNADGLTDVLGNALEWTDTPDSRMVNGEIVLVPEERLTQGSHWWRKREDATLASLEPFRADVPAQRFHTGFRIAKGAAEEGNDD